MDNVKNDKYYLEKIISDLGFIIEHTKGKTKDEIENKLKEIGLEQKDVFILTITQSKIAIVQSYDGQMSSINF